MCLKAVLLTILQYYTTHRNPMGLESKFWNKLGFILILAHFPATWELKIWKLSNFGQNHFSDFETPFLTGLVIGISDLNVMFKGRGPICMQYIGKIQASQSQKIELFCHLCVLPAIRGFYCVYTNKNQNRRLMPVKQLISESRCNLYLKRVQASLQSYIKLYCNKLFYTRHAC